MRVTEVRLNKVTGDEKQLAYGSITLDGDFVINGIHVRKSKDGEPFVSYPSRQNSKGEFKDICFPLARTLREDITTAVLAKYEEL